MKIFECPACDFYVSQLTKAEKKIEELAETKEDRNIERAYLMENNTFEERCSEASHYTWLDDKLEELEIKLQKARKVIEYYANDGGRDNEDMYTVEKRLGGYEYSINISGLKAQEYLKENIDDNSTPF